MRTALMIGLILFTNTLLASQQFVGTTTCTGSVSYKGEFDSKWQIRQLEISINFDTKQIEKYLLDKAPVYTGLSLPFDVYWSPIIDNVLGRDLFAGGGHGMAYGGDMYLRFFMQSNLMMAEIDFWLVSAHKSLDSSQYLVCSQTEIVK